MKSRPAGLFLILHSATKSCSIRANKLEEESTGKLFEQELAQLPPSCTSSTLFIDNKTRFRAERIHLSAFTVRLPNVREEGLIHVTVNMANPRNTRADASTSFPDLDGGRELIKRIQKKTRK